MSICVHMYPRGDDAFQFALGRDSDSYAKAASMDFTGYNREMKELWSARCGAFWPCSSAGSFLLGATSVCRLALVGVQGGLTFAHARAEVITANLTRLRINNSVPSGRRQGQPMNNNAFGAARGTPLAQLQQCRDFHIALATAHKAPR